MTAEVPKYTMEQVEALELAPGTEHEKLEGWVPELASDEDLRQALEKAFDYRGDVTLTLKIRRAHRGLHLQSPDRRHAGRFLRAVLHAEGAGEAQGQLRRDRAPRVQRQGSRRRQALGRLGQGLQRAERPPAKRTSRSIPRRWSRSATSSQRFPPPVEVLSYFTIRAVIGPRIAISRT